MLPPLLQFSFENSPRVAQPYTSPNEKSFFCHPASPYVSFRQSKPTDPQTDALFERILVKGHSYRYKGISAQTSFIGRGCSDTEHPYREVLLYKLSRTLLG